MRLRWMQYGPRTASTASISVDSQVLSADGGFHACRVWLKIQ